MAQTDFDFGFNVKGDAPTYDHQDEPDISENKEPANIWELCSEVKSRIAAITQYAKENSAMDLSTHYDNDGKAGGGKGYKRRDFLKAQHVPKSGCNAKILEFREAPKSMEYSDFLLDIAIGKNEYTWGLRSKSVTLNMLIDALGKRTEKWAGKTIKLVLGGPKKQYVNLG